MRNRILTITTLILIGALIFCQIGVGFLHDAHNAHEKPAQLKAGQEALQKHGEHCKVCSIDLFVNLFVESNEFLSAEEFSIGCLSLNSFDKGFVFQTPTRGRAPPALL